MEVNDTITLHFSGLEVIGQIDRFEDIDASLLFAGNADQRIRVRVSSVTELSNGKKNSTFMVNEVISCRSSEVVLNQTSFKQKVDALNSL